MVDIELLLKEYDANVRIGSLKKTKNNEQPEPEPQDALTLWPEDFLPFTKYMKNQDQSNLDKIEKIAKEDLNMVKPKKLVNIITSIDLMLIKNLTADDLISYNGESSTISISHIQNKNKALKMWLSREAPCKKLFKMLKHAVSYKNYNLIGILVKSLQAKKLSDRKLSKVVYYKNMLNSQDGGIFPFDWMLKDCEDSNLNVSSEVASLRFCRIIEKLKQMKNIEHEFVVKERHKHLLFSKLWGMTNKVLIQEQESVGTYDNFYLVL